MTDFYRNWQQSRDKTQALRQAMLTVMKENPDPYNWAGFTLMGATR
jgi:CHAT domain-containing protein